MPHYNITPYKFPYNFLILIKGHLISKANCQAVNSSKKQTNEFVFTTMYLFSFVYGKKLKTSKRHFEINWPLKTTQPTWHYYSPSKFFSFLRISYQFTMFWHCRVMLLHLSTKNVILFFLIFFLIMYEPMIGCRIFHLRSTLFSHNTIYTVHRVLKTN